ncbi:MAG: SigE family RNA polymerase sigma factor [Actinomycetia bacterium]|nr:SigE family RNA polymerase sigma factor [Actinomycetes bacterium]
MDDFEVFYRSCRDRLAVQVAALTGDPIEAVDHVQEAFIRAWSRWPRVSALDDPEGWVRRVAHNLAVSRFRKARRMLLGLPRGAGRVEFQPTQTALLDALATLPHRERAALVLKHHVGLSVAEVAAELRAPEGTVKSWLSRGRTRLAGVLADAEGDAGST